MGYGCGCAEPARLSRADAVTRLMMLRAARRSRPRRGCTMAEDVDIFKMPWQTMVEEKIHRCQDARYRSSFPVMIQRSSYDGRCQPACTSMMPADDAAAAARTNAYAPAKSAHATATFVATMR